MDIIKQSERYDDEEESGSLVDVDK